MSEIDTLVNQHFLEWELRLKHIDEKMAQAHEAHAKDTSRSDITIELENIRKSRDAVAREIDSVRSLPASEHAPGSTHATGVKAALSAVGLQIEKVLGSIVGAN